MQVDMSPETTAKESMATLQKGIIGRRWLVERLAEMRREIEEEAGLRACCIDEMSVADVLSDVCETLELTEVERTWILPPWSDPEHYGE